MSKPNPNAWQYFDLMDRMERGPLSAPLVKCSTNTNTSNYDNSLVEYYSEDSDDDWDGDEDGDGEGGRSKLKSINNIVRSGLTNNGLRSNSGRVERGGSESYRVERVLRDRANVKRKSFYDESEEEEEGEEEEGGEEEEEEEGVGGVELAKEIKGFMEKFMRVESRKIEMMRETERYRMEMEKKRMDMILDTQWKIVDTIGRAFGECKKAKMGR